MNNKIIVDQVGHLVAHFVGLVSDVLQIHSKLDIIDSIGNGVCI